MARKRHKPMVGPVNLSELCQRLNVCTLRFPNCRVEPGNVVVAHMNRTGENGMGLRAGSDLSAVMACHDCHADADGRTNRIERYTAQYWHTVSMALIETHRYIIDELIRQLEAAEGQAAYWRGRAA